MSESVRTVVKALAGEEDLLFGEGLVNQVRGGSTYPVNKIRGFRPVNDITELNELDFQKFPKAILSVNGLVQLYQHNGTTYEELVTLAKGVTISSAVTTISAVAQSIITFAVSTTHTIESITNGTKNQELTIISTSINTKIKNSAGIVLKGGSDYTIPANTGLRLVYTGSVWAEV